MGEKTGFAREDGWWVRASPAGHPAPRAKSGLGRFRGKEVWGRAGLGLSPLTSKRCSGRSCNPAGEPWPKYHQRAPPAGRSPGGRGPGRPQRRGRPPRGPRPALRHPTAASAARPGGGGGECEPGPRPRSSRCQPSASRNDGPCSPAASRPAARAPAVSTAAPGIRLPRRAGGRHSHF